MSVNNDQALAQMLQEFDSLKESYPRLLKNRDPLAGPTYARMHDLAKMIGPRMHPTVQRDPLGNVVYPKSVQPFQFCEFDLKG